MSAREKLIEELEDLVAPHRTAEELREVEQVIDELLADFGPHPVLAHFQEKVSRLICFLEVGEVFERGGRK